MRHSRRLVTLMLRLWCVVQDLMFVVVGPELAYSCGHWLHGLGGNLPGLTAVLSLPVLGPEISTPPRTARRCCGWCGVRYRYRRSCYCAGLGLLRIAWSCWKRPCTGAGPTCSPGIGILVGLGRWLPFDGG